MGVGKRGDVGLGTSSGGRGAGKRSAGGIEGGTVDNIGVRPKRAEFGETHAPTLSYFGVL